MTSLSKNFLWIKSSLSTLPFNGSVWGYSRLPYAKKKSSPMTVAKQGPKDPESAPMGLTFSIDQSAIFVYRFYPHHLSCTSKTVKIDSKTSLAG